jgi:hypothetical protein
MAARASRGVRSEGYGPTALLVSLFLAHSGRVSSKAHLRFPSDDLLKPFKVKKKARTPWRFRVLHGDPGFKLSLSGVICNRYVFTLLKNLLLT